MPKVKMLNKKIVRKVCVQLLEGKIKETNQHH